MEAKELRIGNLVEIDGSVLELNRKRFEYAVCKDCCLGIKPIPLTEDWLLKFGFIYNDFINGYVLDFEDKTLLFMDNGLDLCLMNNESIDCKYVHQLQNLYFCLAGEELQLK